MSNASQRRTDRRKTTPIDNSPIALLEDEDVTVAPTEAVPEEAEEAPPQPVSLTVQDHLLDLGITVKKVKQLGFSEGAAVKIVETGLQYISNQRALNLQELAQAREQPMPWEMPTALPEAEAEEVTDDPES